MERKSSHQVSTLAMMQQAVARRLVGVRRRIRRQLVVAGLAHVTLAAFILFVVSFVADWRFELTWTMRISLLALAAMALGHLVIRYVLSPMLARWDIFDIAGTLDVNSRQPADRWISPHVATLFESHHELDHEVSPELRDEAARRSYWSLQKSPFEQRLSRSHRRKSWVGLVAGVSLPVLCLLVLPPTLTRTWMLRWLAAVDEPWPRNTQIYVVGSRNGKLLVPRGEPQSVEFKVTQKRARPLDRLRIELRHGDRRRERVSVLRSPDGRYQYELGGIRDAVALTVWGDDAKAGPVRIVPVDRPRLVSIRLQHRHAWDTSDQIHDFDRGDGSISLLPRTRAELVLKSNVPIEKLDADWNQPAMPPFRRMDKRTFAAEWQHEHEVQLRVQLVGSGSGLTSTSRSIGIGLKKDRAPTVTVRPRGVRRRVTSTATIPLLVNARDDFGVVRVDLASQVKRSATLPVSVPPTQGMNDSLPRRETTDGAHEAPDAPPPEETDSPSPWATDAPANETIFGPLDPTSERFVDHEHHWLLDDLKLAPGDTIGMRASVLDACYTGPQSTQSPWLTFSIVNPQELFREILMQQQQLRSRLRKATDQAIDLRDAIITAQFPDDGHALVRAIAAVDREVSTVERRLAETVDEMELNELGGLETLALIRHNVLAPLQRLAEHDVNQQRTLLESLSHGGTGQQAEAILRQDKIVQQLQQVLKNMAQWDSFVDVVNQLDTVIKLQNKLKEATDRLKEKEVESVFDD
jgi:hypothetical protein